MLVYVAPNEALPDDNAPLIEAVFALKPVIEAEDVTMRFVMLVLESVEDPLTIRVRACKVWTIVA